jgi:hypothetical protein
MGKISGGNSWIWFFRKPFATGPKSSKIATTFEGKAVGRNPFRLFTYSRPPIEWPMNERNQSEAPWNVPSSVPIFETTAKFWKAQNKTRAFIMPHPLFKFRGFWIGRKANDLLDLSIQNRDRNEPNFFGSSSVWANKNI